MHLIHRRDKFRAEAILIDKLHAKAAEGKLQFHFFQQLDEVLGDDKGVDRVRLRDARSGQTSELAVQGVFIAALPVIVIAAILAWLLKELPLRTTLAPQTAVEAGEEGLAEASLVPAASHL